MTELWGNQSSLVYACPPSTHFLNSFISGCAQPQTPIESDLFSLISGLVVYNLYVCAHSRMEQWQRDSLKRIFLC